MLSIRCIALILWLLALVAIPVASVEAAIGFGLKF